MNTEYISPHPNRSTLVALLRGIVWCLRRAKARISCKILGAHARVPSSTNLGSGLTLRVPQRLIFGENVSIGSHCHVETNLTILDGTMLASYVAFVGNDHSTVPGESSSSSRSNASFVSIGKNCWVGHGVIFVGNIAVADNVIIGAGAVVTRDLPDSGTYVGVPAKKLDR